MSFVEYPIFPTMIGIGKISNHEYFLPLFKDALMGGNIITNNVSPKLKHTRDIKDQLKEFLDVLTSEVTKYANNHFGLNPGRCNWVCSNAWLNESNEGAFQTKHNHANAFLSVVYYADFPSGSSPTHLYRPDVYMHPFMRFDPDFYHDGNYEFIAPQVESGNFLIFPSYLQHEVPPNINLIRPRITLACNYMPNKVDTVDYVMELK